MGSLFKQNPHSVWHKLVAAQSNPRQLADLCRKHQAEIRTGFPEWRQVPESIRSRPAELKRYGECLVAVARCFTQELGDGSLLQLLSGGDGNPIEYIQNSIVEGRRLNRELKYAEAGRVLSDAAKATATLAGPGQDQLRPILLGTLAEAVFFGKGPYQEAERYLSEALKICQRGNDIEGLQAYLESLYELHRYYGENVLAAKAASDLAALFETSDPIRYNTLKIQSLMVSACEPLNRVMAVIGSVRYEIDDVPLPVGNNVKLVFQRNRCTLRLCETMCEGGKEVAARGDLATAMTMFAVASEDDPHAPDPHYQMAVALRMQGRYRESADACDLTEKLAPGWFSCRSDAWFSRELDAGRIEPEVFAAIADLEDGGHPPPVRVEKARKLAEAARDIGWFHLLHGRALSMCGQPDEARTAYETGLTSRLEDDVRTRLLVALATSSTDPSERIKLAEEAVRINGHLVNAAGARLLIRGETEK